LVNKCANNNDAGGNLKLMWTGTDG